MPGIVLQTNAEKIVNREGGYPTKTFREKIEAGPLRSKVIKKRMVSTIKAKGTDYVVFQCPACGKRNRRSMYDAKWSVDNNICYFNTYTKFII